MDLTIRVAVALTAVALSLHLVSSMIALARCRGSARRFHAGPDAPAVSIIRPVCGVDNYAEETLRSTFTLAYPRYEVIFCVASGRDPVIPLLKRLMASYPTVPCRLLVGEDRINDNPKLNNAAKGWDAAAHDWIAITDSNVLMPSDFLQRLLARWEPGIGLICSPPIGSRPVGLWGELECAFLNTYQARWQYAADTSGFGFAQGKVLFWRRAVLDAAGGIRALGTEPAEDAAATKVVRAADMDVTLVDTPFQQPLGWRSFAEVWRRQVRWARLRRVTFPLYFAPEILTSSLLPLLLGAYAAGAAGISVGATLAVIALVWYGTEAMLAYGARWRLGLLSPLAWIARDLLLPVLWVQGWAGSDFVWRGNEMDVTKSREEMA
ncbi:MAG: ceramide glucosyltransferase [Xanthobacteraceae bacterium]